MQNRRDQAQAHAFVMGRLVSALLRADPDAPMTPLRRFLVGSVAGLLLACIGLVGFGVYGFFVPGGSTAWRTPGALVVEKETGTRYVVVDGVLRPVLNYTSARLILGGAPKVVSVSRNTLRDVPRGLAVGIVGAPDSLPDASRLTGVGWRVCSALRPDAAGVSRPHVIVSVDSTLELTDAAADEALLVRTPASQLFLVAGGRRMRVPDAATVGALGYSASTSSLVGWSWINAVPAGADVVAAEVPFRGEAGPAVEGRATTVGQLFTVPGVESARGEEFFVMRRDGLSPLTALGAALMLADPGTRKSYPDGKVAVVGLSRAAFAGVRTSAVSSVDDALPARAPTLLRPLPGQAPCLGFVMGAGGPQVRLGVAAYPAVIAGTAAAGADQIAVRPGTGLLVRALPVPEATGGTLYLLVDTGVRYPIPDADTASALGYPPQAAVAVPAPILDLLPVGRPLDPAAARVTVEAVVAPTAVPK